MPTRDRGVRSVDDAVARRARDRGQLLACTQLERAGLGLASGRVSGGERERAVGRALPGSG